MRKLVFIIVLFFSTSVFAELAEVYFCETIENIGTHPEDGNIFKNLKPEDNFKIVRFEKENFSFKVTKEKIIFNKEAENKLKGTEVPVIDFYPSSSIFFANDDRIIIKFINGHFFWVDNYGKYGTKIIYAKCESFE